MKVQGEAFELPIKLFANHAALADCRAEPVLRCAEFLKIQNARHMDCKTIAFVNCTFMINPASHRRGRFVCKREIQTSAAMFAVSVKLEGMYIDLSDTAVRALDPVTFPGESISCRFNKDVFIGKTGLNFKF